MTKEQISINKLEKWLKTKGLTVIKSKTYPDELFVERKVIMLNTRSSDRNQLFSLLHECGHFLSRRNKKKFSKKFKLLTELENSSRNKKPLRYYTQEIEDEICAWNDGLKLAKRLSIKIDDELYFKYASRFLMGYMAHAVQGKDWLLK